jgi:hypothetical protein
VRRGGDGITYIAYPSYANTIGAETLSPTGGSFSITYDENGDPISASVLEEGKCYNIGDRIILNDGLGGEITLQVIKASTTYPRSFYVQKVEPIVEYEYNVKDGYYLLTILDGNIHTYYDSELDTNFEDTKTIIYGKQRLIGFEDLDIPPDGILGEINHRKQDASDLIEKNRLFIQLESNGFLKNTFPTFNNPSEDICKRDTGYLLNAIIADLRLGGNNNVINTAQYYFASGTKRFIETELEETRATFEYVKHLAICAMRNWDTFVEALNSPSSSTLVLPSTDGIVAGMRVYEVGVAATLPSDSESQTLANANLTSRGWIRSINRATNTITVFNARSGGSAVNNLSSSNLTYKFVLEQGLGENWTAPSTTVPVIDSTIIQDYDYATGECANVASAINILYIVFLSAIS